MSNQDDNPGASFQWCKALRWKSHGADHVDAEQVRAAFARGGFTYSCLRTVAAFGPDDGAVAPEACTPGRSCYQPHPNSRLPRA